MNDGGSGDNRPESSIQDIGPQNSLARLSAEEIAARTAAGLSASTMVMTATDESCGWMGSARITLWGKDVRNNPRTEAAWAAFSQLVMTTLSGIGVELMEASWSNDQAHRPASTIGVCEQGDSR